MAKTRMYYTRNKIAGMFYHLFVIEPTFDKVALCWTAKGGAIEYNLSAKPINGLPKLKPGQMMIFEQVSPRKGKK